MDHVTGPCCEHAHQFEMFAILQYNTWSNWKLVIKPRIFSFIAKQLALTWQAICIRIVARGLTCTAEVWRG